ncbi:hypothetical protein KXW38_002093, partial [Aspergillus fumigatus]
GLCDGGGAVARRRARHLCRDRRARRADHHRIELEFGLHLGQACAIAGSAQGSAGQDHRAERCRQVPHLRTHLAGYRRDFGAGRRPLQSFARGPPGASAAAAVSAPRRLFRGDPPRAGGRPRRAVLDAVLRRCFRDGPGDAARARRARAPGRPGGA